MTRFDMEHKVKDYITASTQRLEDYSDIEICCEADRQNALETMCLLIQLSTDKELARFCKAIDEGTVNYMTYGCR